MGVAAVVGTVPPSGLVPVMIAARLDKAGDVEGVSACRVPAVGMVQPWLSRLVEGSGTSTRTDHVVVLDGTTDVDCAAAFSKGGRRCLRTM